MVYILDVCLVVDRLGDESMNDYENAILARQEYSDDDCLIHAYKKFCECVRINPLFDIGNFVDVLSECVSEFLQNDYNYSISDENIAELLTANNYEFWENGVDYIGGGVLV